MIHNGQPFFIDFQGARVGPLQYDLASLLFDPYVSLSAGIRSDLLEYTVNRLDLNGQRADQFVHSYRYCCLTRNLQMLGAFGFLSRVKGKTGFETWIPDALSTLKSQINMLDTDQFERLTSLIESL